MEIPTERIRLSAIAVVNAKSILKAGDRVRCRKCPGTLRVFTFSYWSGQWLVSKSGIHDYHPLEVDMVNRVKVDFKDTSKLCRRKKALIKREISDKTSAWKAHYLYWSTFDSSDNDDELPF